MDTSIVMTEAVTTPIPKHGRCQLFWGCWALLRRPRETRHLFRGGAQGPKEGGGRRVERTVGRRGSAEQGRHGRLARQGGRHNHQAQAEPHWSVPAEGSLR